MHPSALQNAKYFFEYYTDASHPATVVDIGAQDVNGSLRDVAPSHLNYIGVDFVRAKGVDIVLTDPYTLPFESESVDIIVSSSCFEHSEMFWVLFLEILRVLRPSGLFYMNAPSNGLFHRYPVDCWRFYPDSGQALVNWAKRNGLKPVCLESYVIDKMEDVWNDYVAVFAKDESLAGVHKNRIINNIDSYTNGSILGRDKLLRERAVPQDQSGLMNAIKRRYWFWKQRKLARLRKAK